LTEVIRPGKCVGCGSCVAVCPPGVVRFKPVPGKDVEPTLAGKCILCETCYNQCPQIAPFEAELENYIFGRSSREGESFGIFRKVYVARASKEDILKAASDGGVVTAILACALSEKLIEGAVVADVEEPWKPVPKLARTYEDLVKAAGTKYSVSPGSLALAEAVENFELKKVAFVGTPCQIRSIRKMQFAPLGAIKYGGKVALTIGLFCSENFYYDKLIKEYVASKAKLDEVSKFSIKGGRFIVEADGRKVIEVPIKEVKAYARTCCQYCTDFAADLADISVGNVDSPDGWSTIIVRTETGAKFFEEAASRGWIESKVVENPTSETLPVLYKLSAKKKSKAAETSKKVQEKT
jgi:coenzyme F420 hydrogenase subunit beta